MTITRLRPYSAAPSAALRSWESDAEKMMPALEPPAAASDSARATPPALSAAIASRAHNCCPVRSISHGITLIPFT